MDSNLTDLNKIVTISNFYLLPIVFNPDSLVWSNGLDPKELIFDLDSFP